LAYEGECEFFSSGDGRSGAQGQVTHFCPSDQFPSPFPRSKMNRDRRSPAHFARRSQAPLFAFPLRFPTFRQGKQSTPLFSSNPSSPAAAELLLAQNALCEGLQEHQKSNFNYL